MPRNPNKTDCRHCFPEGFEAFDSLSDPRNDGNTRHYFGGILFTAFVGELCGVRSYEMMVEFAALHESWLRKWLRLSNGIPCGNTFPRVFLAIEPAAFTHCIALHPEALGMGNRWPVRSPSTARPGAPLPCRSPRRPVTAS